MKIVIGDSTPQHRRIVQKSLQYGKHMAESDSARTFDRRSLAVAYMIGAEETLAMASNFIKECALLKGLTPEQEHKLIIGLHKIADIPLTDEPETYEWD